jgi:hypothetical protein
LNELRHRAPDAWQREQSKYAGRERVRELAVPLLDCLWNDVLHLSPVHPRELVSALEAAGFEVDRRRFFKVDASLLDPRRTVVFLNSTDREHRFDPSQWAWFDPGLVASLSSLPEAARGYYADCARDGRTPLRFACVPHVLYRGSLDIRKLIVTEV